MEWELNREGMEWARKGEHIMEWEWNREIELIMKWE